MAVNATYITVIVNWKFKTIHWTNQMDSPGIRTLYWTLRFKKWSILKIPDTYLSLKIILRISSYVRCKIRLCIPVYILCHSVQSVCYKESCLHSYDYSCEYNCSHQLLPQVLSLNTSIFKTVNCRIYLNVLIYLFLCILYAQTFC